MPHLAKDIPYRSTSIDYTKTMGEISEMLREFGAAGIRWTELPEEYDLPIVEFLVRTERKGREMEFRVMVKPPMIPDRKKINGKIVNTVNRNASMRLTYWFIKSRLEGVRWGLEDLFDAFMLRVIHTLPDGTETTIGESIKDNPDTFKLILPTFDLKTKGLPVRVIKDG
jgi:hypothetical protein